MNSKTPKDRWPVVLSVAGSDSGGGAGIQADLRTMAAIGVHGATVITALTAQNSRSVEAIEPVAPPFVAAQLDAVLGDLEVCAVKTGMLACADTVAVVAERLVHHAVGNLVVDPVMAAESGRRLLDEEGCRLLVERLLPRAVVVTPNLAEAGILTGRRVRDVASMKEAARAILDKGAGACLVKGGHLEGDACDVFDDGQEVVVLRGTRLPGGSVHGTGCTLASAIAAELALGRSLRVALDRARDLVRGAITGGRRPGSGGRCVEPLVALRREASRHRLWSALMETVEKLEHGGLGRLVPEVQSQMVVALEGAESPADVLGFPGRLVRIGGEMRMVSAARFGASSHMARVALAVMRHDPEMRAAMNIRYGEDVLEAFGRAGLSMASFDRREEPRELRPREGYSLPLGVSLAIERAGGVVPDGIADPGDVGKEPMIRLLGRGPAELAAKLTAIAGALDQAS